ncbi:MAG: aspartate aminotransferase family protein [Verrucomicrobiota bacterium]
MLPEIITAVPGPESRELASRLKEVESRNVTYVSHNFPVFWKKSQGANVWDVDGNCFLDWTSGFGVATAGFNPDWLVEVIQGQSRELFHAMGDVHPSAQKAELCSLLSQVTFERWNAGQGKVLLGNSGFEAVEAALKTAYLATGKPGIIAFENSYHGLGYGAVTVTGRNEFRRPFQSQLADITQFVPFPQAGLKLEGQWRTELSQRILKMIREQEIGAILVEPIQGRAGEIFPPEGFLQCLRTICDECDVLLILDEIYTGFWRTDYCFACEAEKVVPDIICLGKAMSGGYPISACIAKSHVMDSWPESTGEALHTSTFLGNPLGCAMSVASVKHWMKDSIQHEVKLCGKRLSEALETLKQVDGIVEVRGRGLLWGIELGDKNGQSPGQRVAGIIEQGLKEGAILLGGGVTGETISLTPSISMNLEELDWTMKLLKSLL